MKTITDLTAEELALVQAAREKAEQEKLAKQADLEKRITEKRAYAVSHQAKGEEQVKATYNFFKDFKSGEFEVVEYSTPQKITIKDYTTNEISFNEDYTINNAYIQHKETKNKIIVEPHTVFKRFRSENKGYKMFIGYESRAYSKASTVENKLLEEINAKRAKQNRDEIRNTYIVNLIETQPINNATIEKTYIHSDYVTSRNGIQINYDNGSVVTCSISVSEEGKVHLSIYKTEFPKPKIEGETTMDKLQFISKLKF